MNQGLTKRILSIANKAIGFILFIICAVAIYSKVTSNDNLQKYGGSMKDQFLKITFMEWVILLILFFLNYLIEAIKWEKVLKSLHPMTITQSFKSVLVGQAFAFFTPVRSGDYVGRILFLAKESKLKGVAQMAWSSYAQLLITLLMGTVGLFFNLPFLPWLKWLAPFITLVAFIIYFSKGHFEGWLKKLTSLQIATDLKIKLVLLSLLKYGIFILQYAWVVKILAIPIPTIDLCVAVAVLLMCLSIIPAIALTDLVIRGQLIVLLLAPWYSNVLMLICLSTMIWVVNFLLPAIIGSFLLLGFRINR
ncbi:MAG: hypothetical protein WCJ68_02465 [Chitinophagia bacterium]|jgi:hypothetical protein